MNMVYSIILGTSLNNYQVNLSLWVSKDAKGSIRI